MELEPLGAKRRETRFVDGEKHPVLGEAKEYYRLRLENRTQVRLRPVVGLDPDCRVTRRSAHATDIGRKPCQDYSLCAVGCTCDRVERGSGDGMVKRPCTQIHTPGT